MGMGLDALDDFDFVVGAVGAEFLWNVDFVVGEGAGDFDAFFPFDGDGFEELVARGVAEFGGVFENNQGTRVHAACGAGC